VSVTNDVIENFSGVRIKFWHMKVLWHRKRRYVAIPNMEVWLHLVRLVPDVPDGWNFADAPPPLPSFPQLSSHSLTLR